MIRRHRWSILSLAITIVASLGIRGYVQYQYRFHYATNFAGLSSLGACAVILSVLTACIGLYKERGSIVSIVALVLGVFSALFYAV